MKPLPAKRNPFPWWPFWPEIEDDPPKIPTMIIVMIERSEKACRYLRLRGIGVQVPTRPGLNVRFDIGAADGPRFCLTPMAGLSGARRVTGPLPMDLATVLLSDPGFTAWVAFSSIKINAICRSRVAPCV
jgi:hypothetical protein